LESERKGGTRVEKGNLRKGAGQVPGAQVRARSLKARERKKNFELASRKGEGTAGGGGRAEEGSSLKAGL